VGNNEGYVFFRLKEARRNTWIFENPVHDYPNLIEYQLIDENTLIAKTTNLRGNKEIVFNLERITE
jgi:hypothetical protein